jgi:hypothetical protein
VAFAFLVVMAFATVPSPLYGLYRARDHFSLSEAATSPRL